MHKVMSYDDGRRRSSRAAVSQRVTKKNELDSA